MDMDATVRIGSEWEDKRFVSDELGFQSLLVEGLCYMASWKRPFPDDQERCWTHLLAQSRTAWAQKLAISKGSLQPDSEGKFPSNLAREQGYEDLANWLHAVIE
eukprot:764299-Hanusia_phi.AAC.2